MFYSSSSLPSFQASRRSTYCCHIWHMSTLWKQKKTRILFWHVKLVYLTTALCKMNTCHHQIKLDICAIVSNCGQMSRAAFVQVKPYAQPILDICHHELAVHMYRRRGWNGRNHSIKLRRPQVDPPRLNTDLSWAQAMLRNGKSCHWDFKK